MSCGSYGDAEEGKLIVCTQCGQCYHPYCANIKVSHTYKLAVKILYTLIKRLLFSNDTWHI